MQIVTPENGRAVVHDKPYYFKAAFLNKDGSPTVLFRSEHSDDLEIRINAAGGLDLRRASVETIEAAAMLTGQHLDSN